MQKPRTRVQLTKSIIKGPGEDVVHRSAGVTVNLDLTTSSLNSLQCIKNGFARSRIFIATINICSHVANYIASTTSCIWFYVPRILRMYTKIHKCLEYNTFLLHLYLLRTLAAGEIMRLGSFCERQLHYKVISKNNSFFLFLTFLALRF